MAAKRTDPGDPSEPNLELPGFGLRRRKKKDAAVTETTPVDAGPDESEPRGPESAEPVSAEPVSAEPASPEPVPAELVSEEPTAILTPAPAPAPTPAEQARGTKDTADSETEDEADTEAKAEAARRAALQEQARREVAQERERKEQERQRRREEKQALKEAKAADRAEHHGSRLPAIDARLAAALTGLIVGLATVTMAWLAAQGCEAVRGVGSCGGFGVLALIAILAVDVLLGSVLLAAWRISEPTSTSFFAVGVIAVSTMLFFLDTIESRWMLLVIPLLSAAAYAVGWLVTDNLIEEEAPVADEEDLVR